MVSKDLTKRYQAGQIIKEMATLIGGTGGASRTWRRPAGKMPQSWTRRWMHCIL
jgi:alanyl-tRNA synthetase